MPIYNDASRLEKSINSFLKQTLDEKELICVNDGSTDNSLEILNEFAEKYECIKVFSQENQGSGKARNLGITKANGEYIGFLDADDFFIDDDALEKLYKEANRNDADLVTGNIKLVNAKDEFSPFVNFKYFEDYESFEPQEYGIPWSFYKSIYKKDFLISNSIFFPDLLRGQDPVFLAEALAKVDIIYAVPTDVYAYFYVNGANQCNTYKKRFDHMMHYKMVFDFLKDPKFDEVKHLFRYEMMGFINFLGVKGASDIINASREIFSEDSKLLRDFEDVFYFTYKNNENLKHLLNFTQNPENPRISVIVPVYNVEKYLEDAIGSLLNQTFVDFELLCVDDGSSDNSLEILEVFAKKDSRIKIINKENGDFGFARNRWLGKASGEYIYFFNPNDYVLPNTLEDLYVNAIWNESDLVFSKIAHFIDNQNVEYDSPYYDLDNVFKGVNFNRFTFDYHDVKHYVMYDSYEPFSKLYKKSFLEADDDFLIDLGLAFDDILFHVKSILSAKKISFVPKFLYHYRYANPSSVNYTSTEIKDIFKVFDLVETFLREKAYFEELNEDFYKFYLNHTSYFILPSNSDDYFKLAKDNYESIDEKYVENLSEYMKKVYDYVLISKNLEEYKVRVDYYMTSEKNLDLTKSIESLESKNKKLKNQNEKIKKQNEKIKKQNEKLKKEKSSLNKFKNDLLSSKSWKLTGPFRKFKKILKF